MSLSSSAFEKLYETHGPRMKSLAYNLLGNAVDAEDAVQEAFLKAFRAQETFRGQASTWTWLCRILINACYDIGRRRVSRREDQASDALLEVKVATSADHPLRLTVERLVADLSPRLREVFLLYEVEGMSHREVGETLGIAEGTSKAALSSAKSRLAAALRRSAMPLSEAVR